MRKVVVDTSVWVSALLNPDGPPSRVLAALDSGRFVHICSEPLLAELVGVLSRPRIARKYRIGPAAGLDLAARLRRRSVLVVPTGTLRLCRDPGDDVVIETAALGGADTLVSRDDDLKGDQLLIQILAAGGVEVLTVRHFLMVLDLQDL